jgi:hypothetical protein
VRSFTVRDDFTQLGLRRMAFQTQFRDRPNYPFKKQLVLVCSIVVIAVQAANPITWAASEHL